MRRLSRFHWTALAWAAGLYAAALATHYWALRLPYYWDEAGYFVPAARDLLLHGWWVPRSTLANGHPPLVMALLALAWRLVGYHIWATRALMLGFYAALLGGVRRLAAEMDWPQPALAGRAKDIGIAAGWRANAALLLIALAPLAFAQAPLAQLDLPTAALLAWALVFRHRRRIGLYWLLAAAACVAKETAVLLPFSLALADTVRAGKLIHAGDRKFINLLRRQARAVLPHALTLLPLLAWLLYYHSVTGFWFGNAGFLAYNLGPAFSPQRMALSLARRLWQLFGYNGAWLPVVLAAWGWRRGRPRALLPAPARPACDDLPWIIVIYLLFHAAVGGAVLARYLLPAEAVLAVLLACGLSWLPRRNLALAACALLLMINWFWRAPYPYPYEDNLAYVSFIHLQQAAARRLASLRPAPQPVLTAWPATNELTTPALGYVTRPLRVAPVRNFNRRGLRHPPRFAIALLYSRIYQPRHNLLSPLPRWRSWIRRYYHYQPPLSRRALLKKLRLRVLWAQHADGQWALLGVPHHRAAQPAGQ